MNLALKDNESLDDKVAVTLTRRDVMLLNLCLGVVSRDHTKGSSLRFDIEDLQGKLSVTSRPCRCVSREKGQACSD